MKKILIKLKVLLVIGMIVIPAFVIAQDDDPPPINPEVEDVPFDGGVSLLVAAGIGYGLKKAHDKKKAEKKKFYRSYS